MKPSSDIDLEEHGESGVGSQFILPRSHKVGLQLH